MSKYFNHNQFRNACHLTHNRSMAVMANHAIGLLEQCFFNPMSTRAQCADDSPIVMKRDAIKGYVMDTEKKSPAIHVKWTDDDITTQVMFFMKAILEGVEIIFTDGKEITIRNPLYPTPEELARAKESGTDILAGRFFKVAIGEKDGVKNGEFVIDMNVNLPDGFYDPAREAVKAAKDQAAKNAAVSGAKLPESVL